MSFEVRPKLFCDLPYILCLVHFYAENHCIMILKIYFAEIKVNIHFGILMCEMFQDSV